MELVWLNKVGLRYGDYDILDGADLSVAEGDSLALIGRNGCGKTTLLKLLAGIIEPDGGSVERRRGLKVAYLQQDVPTDLSSSAFSVVAAGLGARGKLLCEYIKLSEILRGGGGNDNLHACFDGLVQEMDELGAWGAQAEVSDILGKLEIDADVPVEKMSAGLKRRVLLGRELVSKPDLLLLDEPTNHLDIDSTIWLENFLKNCGKTLVFVSHDRSFLRALAGRVVEVDRAKLVSFNCGFDEFLVRRDEFFSARERQEREFDKKLAREEAWLRQGIKARRTRNEGRVRELMHLRRVRKARREGVGSLSLDILGAGEGGEKVLEAKNVSVSFGENKLIDNFSTTIFRGDKIGIIGKNGVGKTTLLKTLLGKIEPDSGTVELGTGQKVLYFDQLRGRLDDKMRPFDFVGEGSDFVFVGGRSQSVMGYLQDFLFTPEQIHGEIAMLSGGEKSRLLLAKLFTNPANLLVLDEPTNDLDMQTIELLEQALVSFKGTVLVVSHDRSFLNNIVSGVFCFEGGGKIKELVGGYDEWEAYKLSKPAQKTCASQKKTPAKPHRIKKEKFTNREREELSKIPGKIAEVESEMQELCAKLQDVDFIRSNPGKIAEINARMAELQKQDEALFERWGALEERKRLLEEV